MAAALVLVTYRLARLAVEGQTAGREEALLAALLLLTFPGIRQL